MNSLHQQADEWYSKREAWKAEMHSISDFDWGSLNRFLGELYQIAQTTPQSNREFMEQQMPILKRLALGGANTKTIWTYLNALRDDPIHQYAARQLIGEAN